MDLCHLILLFSWQGKQISKAGQTGSRLYDRGHAVWYKFSPLFYIGYSKPCITCKTCKGCHVDIERLSQKKSIDTILGYF